MIWVWVALGVASLVTAVVASLILWHPEKNVSRDMFSHWILSLIRFYEDAAYLSVALRRSSVPLLRFRRAGTSGDGCDIVLEILDGTLVSGHRRDLLDEIRKQRYEPTLETAHRSDDAPIAVKIEVSDIWSMGAGNRAARLAHAVLDVMSVDRDTKFDLSFHGARSRSRTFEARDRQKRGEKL